MDKKLLFTPSEKLAADAVDEITCQKYMNEYTDCIIKHQASGNYKDCVKLMEQFRYCMLLNAKIQQEKGKRFQ